jgi:hypothetical protein
MHPRQGDIETESRRRAASWRSQGLVDRDLPDVRPPASSRLLFGYLEPHRVAPLQVSADRRRALIRYLRAASDTSARVDRLEHYTELAVAELAKTVARLDVELAEARARIGFLEDALSQADHQ